jgi:tryptophan-rich sensory protein
MSAGGSGGGRGRLLPVIVAAGAAILVASVGATMTDIGPWYQGLAKPSWQPPDWLFGPAWTLIFALAALSAVTAWRDAPSQAEREWMVGLFAINGVLNILWSALFFRLRRPDWALVEVVLLWLSVLALMLVLRRYSRPAALMLLPYLAWVAFAAVLNLAVVRLNAPFG